MRWRHRRCSLGSSRTRSTGIRIWWLRTPGISRVTSSQRGWASRARLRVSDRCFPRAGLHGPVTRSHRCGSTEGSTRGPMAARTDYLYVDIYPEALQVEPGEHVPHRQLMRPVTDDRGGGEASAPLPRGRRDAPLVYVTMGTVFNDTEPLRRAVEGVRALAVRVLATVGPNADPAVLGEQPEHVLVERYVPQTAVLPLCDAVVSHAGSGTVLGSLGLGLPQVCLPQGADQFLNAEAVAASGAGLSIAPDKATVPGIGDAVTSVLNDKAYRAAAQKVAASIDAMPTPDDVVAALERLV